MTTTTLPKVKPFKADAIRPVFGEWLKWNNYGESWTDCEGAYNALDIGRPRNSDPPSQLHSIWRPDGHAVDVYKLQSGYSYLLRNLTYGQFSTCCGENVMETIPLDKRWFLRGLWLVLGGQNVGVSLGRDNANAAKEYTHAHHVQFSEDWATVRISILPLRGGAYSTDAKGLRLLSKAFEKHRAAMVPIMEPSEVADFKLKEVKLNSPEIERLKRENVDALSNVDYAKSSHEEWAGYLKDSTCRLESIKSALLAMSETNRPFDGILPLFSDTNNDVLSQKRELAGRARNITKNIEAAMASKRRLDNALNPKSCYEALMVLVKNKVVKGFRFDRHRLLVCFEGYTMPIGPKKGRCEHNGDRCRCQIVMKGHINIAPFTIFIAPSSRSLIWGVQRYRSNVYHPHFKTDGNYCLGGYEEAVEATLKVFDITGFLMVMADYIHSFDVHSMLTDDSKLDFVPKNPSISSDGIFEQDPEDYENGEGDEDDDNCSECGGEGCSECSG